MLSLVNLNFLQGCIEPEFVAGQTSEDHEVLRTAGQETGATIYRGSIFVPAPAFGDKAVADPGFGLDVLFSGFGFELFAQLADEDAQVLRLVG